MDKWEMKDVGEVVREEVRKMRKQREPLDLDGTLRRAYVALAFSILSLLLEIAKVLRG